MTSWRRGPFLVRLASRYAARHRTQTLRAILGLLVATTVLAMGLGLPESIAVSLEETALARYGPVDVTVNAGRPFDASLLTQLAGNAGVRAEGATGVATLTVAGPALHPENGLAQALATIRGVSPRELEVLGPFPPNEGQPVPEPGPGEVVLSSSLANTLDARVGDRIVLRAAPPGVPDVEIEPTLLVGVGGLPAPAAPTHTIDIRDGAVGLGAEVAWSQLGATVTLEATSPSGVAYANQSAETPLRLVVEGPLEPGTWTVRVRATSPVPYQGGAAAVYLPADVVSFVAVEVRVVGIAKEEGRAGITGRPTAIVDLAELQRALNTTGNVTQLYFHVEGGDARRTVDAIERALGDDADDFVVRADKVELLESAAEVGAELTGFLLVMGAFTLLAAVLLAFTLFSALVEERRAELGIARALGLTRGEVAFAMTIEGALYAGLAALAGLVLGLGFLWGLLTLIDSFAGARSGITFAMHVGVPTLVTAFAVGTLLPLLTIGIASLRFARLDPARAMRGMPDDPRARRRTGLVFAGILAVAGAALMFGEVSWLAGVPLVAAGVAVGTWSLGKSRVAALFTAAGALHLVWYLYAFDSFSESRDELDPILTLGRGAILALGLSVLAVASARPYERVAALLGKGRIQRASFLAFKYVVARRRPAGLTMAMISLVVVIVTVMGTLFVTFSGSIVADEGGFTVLGNSPLALNGFPRPLPNDIAEKVEVAEFIPGHIELDQATVTRNGEPIRMLAGLRQFLGVTPSFAETNEYALSTRAPKYATDRDAWAAVAAGEAILPPDWMLDRNGLVAGDELVIDTASTGPKTYILAGGVESDFAFETFFPAHDVRAMGFPATTRVFVKTLTVDDSDEVAHRFTAVYAEEGLTFTSIPEEVARLGQAAQALVLVFESFLALGLFVGLAATGFLASRAVHERIRDIGTLRALGYEESDVRRAFMMESTLTAGLGILIGIASGLVVAHSIWWRSVRETGVAFQPPVLVIVGFTLAVLALAAFASRGPAARAARLAPAIAVRHVE